MIVLGLRKNEHSHSLTNGVPAFIIDFALINDGM